MRAKRHAETNPDLPPSRGSALVPGRMRDQPVERRLRGGEPVKIAVEVPYRR
jgi:hypothetical protein